MWELWCWIGKSRKTLTAWAIFESLFYTLVTVCHPTHCSVSDLMCSNWTLLNIWQKCYVSIETFNVIHNTTVLLFLRFFFFFFLDTESKFSHDECCTMWLNWFSVCPSNVWFSTKTFLQKWNSFFGYTKHEILETPENKQPDQDQSSR